MTTRYEVSKGGTAVLTFTSEPGVILSTALAAPGAKPLKHPFLNARALDARHEHQLGALLRASSSVEDFIQRLRGAGYEVQAGRPA
jgi:cell division septation protein DedD